MSINFSMADLLLLITTESSKKIAKKIGKLLVKRKLAACVSIKEIYSIYRWGLEIEQIKEFEIVIKSKSSKLELLINTLKKELSYKLPQFIYKSFDSEINYYKWIDQTVN